MCNPTASGWLLVFFLLLGSFHHLTIEELQHYSLDFVSQANLDAASQAFCDAALDLLYLDSRLETPAMTLL